MFGDFMKQFGASVPDMQQQQPGLGGIGGMPGLGGVVQPTSAPPQQGPIAANPMPSQMPQMPSPQNQGLPSSPAANPTTPVSPLSGSPLARSGFM